MSTSVLPQTTAWTVDPVHSVAEFKVKHMMISSVKGHFAGIRGTLTLDGEDVTRSRVEASLDAASITTGDSQRDAHLKSADFFDVDKFPELTFVSRRFSRREDGSLEVAGDLTIHGVTRAVVFSGECPSDPVRDPWGSDRIGLEATARINRKDFGLNWNAALETGGILVGDEVAISLDVQFVKA
jgi:polyisoprenoid-binding protein YceI